MLGHEIAHAFQIDIARSVRQDAFTLPGWFIEGMAEYLSLGPDDAHTSMWVRDAARHDRLPTLKQLNDPRYFPYRYGHAFWSHLAERFGDGVLSKCCDAARGRTLIKRISGSTPGSVRARCTAAWHASIDGPYPTREGGAPSAANGAAACSSLRRSAPTAAA